MANHTVQNAASEVAFVFNNVANHEALAAAFRAGVEVHVLDANEDGLAQIAAVLSGRGGIEALHVVGHGAPGSLNFGSVTLDSGNIGVQSEVLGKIGAALAEGGDILLYGCDVGATALGAQFVGQIAQATGADVAASDDATGAAQRGGDWVLEYRIGAVTADGGLDPAVVRSLDTLLALPDGLQDVTATMNKQGVGTFLPGFTLTSTLTFDPDSEGPIDGLYISNPYTVRSGSFTVAADATTVATFDLTDIDWEKYSTDGDYTITVVGLRGTTEVSNMSITTVSGVTTYTYNGNFSGFTGLTAFRVDLVTDSDAALGFPLGQNTFDSFTVANAVPPDTTPPTLVITSSKSALKIGETAIITFTFSEDTGTSFTQDDITVTGGTLSAISGSGLVRTATFTPTANTNSTTATITVANESYQDAAGNKGAAVELVGGLTVDTLAPPAPSTPDLVAASDLGRSSSDNITSDTTPTFSGTAEANATITLYDGATVIGTATANGAGEWTFTANPMSEGAHSLIATASDAAGNTSSSGALNFTIDTAAPSAPSTPDLATASDLGFSNTDNLTSDNTPTIAGTAEAGATVNLYGNDGTTVIGTGIANGSGAWTITTSTLPEGSHSITAKATDAAGNESSASTGIEVTIDTTAPTVTIASDKSTLKGGESATVTFTFSEDPGSSFDAAAITVTGGTLGEITGSGLTRSVVFTPSANSIGTASIGVAGGYTDVAGNNGAAGSAVDIGYDTLIPTVAISSNVTALKAGETAIITFTFSHDPGSSFGPDDIEVAGGTLSDPGGTGVQRTATFTPATDTNGGVASITVKADSWTGANGNLGAAGTTPTLTFDTKAPTVTITSNPATLKAGEQAVITFTFSEDPLSSFGDDDIAVEGGTLGPVTGTGTMRTATFTPTPDTDGGTASIKVVAGKYSDAAGNTNPAEASVSLAYDTLAPAAPSITLDPDYDTGTSASDNLTMHSSFIIKGTGTDGTTIRLYDGSTLVDTAPVVDGNWSIEVAGQGNGAHSYAATAVDAAGNTSPASAALAVTVDAVPPTLAISSSTTSLKAGDTAAITFTFSEDPGSTFNWDGTAGDIEVTGGTLSAITGTGSTRTAVFTPNPGSNGGPATITVTGGSWTDAAGNGGGAAALPSLTFDTLAPTLVISTDKSELRVGQTATITFTFSEEPADFATEDIAVSGGTLGPLTGTGTTRTAVFTPDANKNGGSASISVAAGAYADAAGNDGGEGPAIALTYDTLRPAAPSTPALDTLDDSGHSDSDGITNSADLRFSGTAEAGSTVTLYDGATFLDSVTAADGNWAFTVSGLGEGSHSITAVATDGAGNLSAVSAAGAIVIDRTAPTLTISSDKSAVKAGGTALISFTFSEDPGDSFDWGSVEVTGGTLSAFAGTGTLRTATFTPAPDIENGTASIAVAANSWSDAAGNGGGGAVMPDLDIDTVAPTLTITTSTTKLLAGQEATITFTFSEDPGSSFTLADIAATGGTVSDLSSSGAVRTAVLTPAPDFNGTASISLAADAYTDAAGNGGAYAVSPDLAINTIVPPVPSVPDLASGSDSGMSVTDNITNDTTPTFSGTAEDGATVKLYAGEVEVGETVATGGVWSITPALPAGTHTLKAVAINAAGNASAASGTIAVTIDTSAPTVGITSDVALLKAGQTATITFAFSEDPGSTFTAADIVVTGGAVSGLTTTGSTRTATFTPVAGTDAGTATITVAGGSYTDTAGNSGGGALLNLAFDTKAPAKPDAPRLSAASDTGPSSSDGVTNAATLVFEGTAEAGEKVRLVNAATNAELGEAVVTDGTWSFSLTGVPEGVLSVAAIVTDAAGNESVRSDPTTVAVDRTPPGALALALEADTGQLGDDAVTSNGVVQVSGIDPGATWEYSLNNGASWTAGSGSSLTLATDGSHTVIARQVDLAGNAGASSAPLALTLDKKAPTATVTLDRGGITKGQTAVVTIDFGEVVTGFDPATAVISVDNGTLSVPVGTDGRIWKATFTPTDNVLDTTNVVTVSNAGVVDLAGNIGAGTSSSHNYVVQTRNAPPDDRGPVTRTPFIDPTTGTPSEVVNVAAAPPTGSPQIPLAGGAVTASLPGGVGLQAFGPTTPLSNAQALIDLIMRIEDRTADGSVTQAHMTGLGQHFLSGLGADVMLQTQTILPTAAAAAPSGQPIVIAGAPGSSVAGLVIDGTGLPQGSTLQLDHVGFAAVMGNLRLVGGAGANYVVGDGASQVIFLGADDDILNGGGGNDFIGSGSGDDQLDGGTGDDLVVGGVGNDKLYGGAGADVLNGGRSATGAWNFYLAANGKIMARHSGAVFAQDGAELVQAAELDASVPELGFLHADAQQLAGVALLYAALGRAPDLAGLTYWSRPGMSLGDVANGVLASSEWLDGPLGQLGNEAYVRAIYEKVLGRTADAAGLAYWVGRLDGTEGTHAATRTDVLAAVALSDEHRAAALTADGFAIGTASLPGEAGWFTGSGDDRLDGGAGNDQLVGGDGFDTAVFAGQRSDYRVVLGSDRQAHVVHAASGEVDTLSSIEAAEFGDSTLDLAFLGADPAMLDAVGLLYQAVLDRASDAGGLNWWLSLGMGKAQLAQAFTQSGEFQARYGTMSDAAFVQALYANSGLDAAAAGGVKSWEAYLANHTRAELVASWITHDSVISAHFANGGLWLV